MTGEDRTDVPGPNPDETPDPATPSQTAEPTEAARPSGSGGAGRSEEPTDEAGKDAEPGSPPGAVGADQHDKAAGPSGAADSGAPAAAVAVADPVVATAVAPNKREVLSSGAFGALMIVAAVFVIVDAVRLPETSEAVGPAAVPLPVGVLLGVVGAVLLVQARLRFAAATAEQDPRPRAGLRVFGMVVALVGFALLLPLLGYVVTAAALFTAAALLLGAPHPWRTAATGWALAAIVFLVFDRLIGLSLPTGPWGF
jgi:putative tricarboxylic transport membrane protein